MEQFNWNNFKYKIYTAWIDTLIYANHCSSKLMISFYFSLTQSTFWHRKLSLCKNVTFTWETSWQKCLCIVLSNIFQHALHTIKPGTLYLAYCVKIDFIGQVLHRLTYTFHMFWYFFFNLQTSAAHFLNDVENVKPFQEIPGPNVIQLFARFLPGGNQNFNFE